MHALLYVQVLRSLDMLRRAHSFVHHHQDIIPLLHSILVIAMAVVIEVCQLHTVRNIAGESNREVLDNMLTNWAARKINYDNREHILASRICMYAGVLFKTDMYLILHGFWDTQFP